MLRRLESVRNGDAGALNSLAVQFLMPDAWRFKGESSSIHDAGCRAVQIRWFLL